MTSTGEDAGGPCQDHLSRPSNRSTASREGSFFTWLNRIRGESTLSHLRKNRLGPFSASSPSARTTRFPARWLAPLLTRRGVGRDPLSRELQEKLNDAMQKLSINHRTVVTLFEIDELSHQEIAEVMVCSVGTVRSRLHYESSAQPSSKPICADERFLNPRSRLKPLVGSRGRSVRLRSFGQGSSPISAQSSWRPSSSGARGGMGFEDFHTCRRNSFPLGPRLRSP